MYFVNLVMYSLTDGKRGRGAGVRKGQVLYPWRSAWTLKFVSITEEL